MPKVEISMTEATYKVLGEQSVRTDLTWMAKRDYNYEGGMIFFERWVKHVTKSGHKCTIVYITGNWSNDNQEITQG
jgi:hypothetical protein